MRGEENVGPMKITEQSRRAPSIPRTALMCDLQVLVVLARTPLGGERAVGRLQDAHPLAVARRFDERQGRVGGVAHAVGRGCATLSG